MTQSIQSTRKLEQLNPPWENVHVYCRNSKGVALKLVEILNIESKFLYRQEPLLVTAIKCANLFFFGNILYFIAYTSVQVTRLFTVPLANRAPFLFLNELWHLVKVPIYFLGIQIAAAYGMICPLEGRELIASLETDLHNGKTRKEARQYQEKEPFSDFQDFSDLFCEENPKTAFFLAYCMQPLGRSDNPVIRLETIPTV